ncbi:MAG: hypothetical protein RR397_08085 [Odoribacter sp.]
MKIINFLKCLLLITFVYGVFVSCGVRKNLTEIKKSYADSVHLNIKGNLILPEIIWDNKEIYLQAFRRMEACKYVYNGRFKWNIKNGAILKISENIFQYLVQVWKNDNKNLATGQYEIRMTPEGYYLALPKDSPTDIFKPLR